MLVSYYPQALLPTTLEAVTEALHRMTIDQRFSPSNVVRLARAEGRTYHAVLALYEKSRYTTDKPETRHTLRQCSQKIVSGLQYRTTDPF